MQLAASVQIMLLASDGLLNPDFSGNAEKALQFYNLYRSIWPIMMPADDGIAALWIVPVRPEAAGSELKLNAADSLTVSDKSMRKAVWKLRLNPYDPEFKALGDMREQEDNTKFIHRRVFHWRI